MIYSADIADIANDDIDPYIPSIAELEEEERTHIYKVDDYIKNTICPRYHHQLLKREIEYYQDKHSQNYYFIIFVIHLFLYMIPTQIIVKTNLIEDYVISFLISTTIGAICYIIVKLIYKKYWKCSSIRINNYYEVYSSHDWYSHYCYLLSIKQTVIFRYALRKIFESIAFGVYLLFFLRVPD